MALRATVWHSLELLAIEADRALSRRLAALVLAGGYGRGEGAVVRRGGQPRLYNDLDLIVDTTVTRPGDAGRLLRLAHHYEQALGVAVDLSPPIPLGAVRHVPQTLLWNDVFDGHQVVAGPPQVLRHAAPSWYGQPLPLVEATRLLLNRGAGLLWAMRVLWGLEPAPDPDFVRRNLHKCALACGDALLLVGGCWPAQTAQRGWLLRTQAGFTARLRSEVRDEVLSGYARACRFKAAPDEAASGCGLSEVGAAARLWLKVLLAVEEVRTGRALDDLPAYVAWRELREPTCTTPWSHAANLMRNLRLGQVAVAHPREALYRELPVLLAGLPAPLAAGVKQDWAHRSAALLRVWKTCLA